MNIKHTSNRQARPRGFSLAEVALAVAIAGVALLSVVGLLPVIMESERNSSGKSVLPQLVSQAMGQLAALPYPATLPHQVEMYFSETGELLKSSDAAFYNGTAFLKESPAPITGTPPEGEAPPAGPQGPGSNFCLVTLSLKSVTAPQSPPMIFHASLAKK